MTMTHWRPRRFRLNWDQSFFVVFFLVVPLVALVPLAHASPVDQTWIAGSYDDDLDEIFLLAVSMDAVSKARCRIEPASLVVGDARPARSERWEPLPGDDSQPSLSVTSSCIGARSPPRHNRIPSS